MGGHVFVSYSRADARYVDGLVRWLRAHGIPTWVDHEIDYGDRWASVIQSKLDEAVAVVVVVSSHSVVSDWVEKEVSYAQELRKPVLPLQLVPGARSIRLINIHHEDVSGGQPPRAQFAEHLRKLTAVPQPSPAPITAAPVPAPAPIEAAPAPVPPTVERSRSLWTRAVASGEAGISLAFAAALACYLVGAVAGGVVEPDAFALLVVCLPYPAFAAWRIRRWSRPRSAGVSWLVRVGMLLWTGYVGVGGVSTAVDRDPSALCGFLLIVGSALMLVVWATWAGTDRMAWRRARGADTGLIDLSKHP